MRTFSKNCSRAVTAWAGSGDLVRIWWEAVCQFLPLQGPHSPPADHHHWAHAGELVTTATMSRSDSQYMTQNNHTPLPPSSRARLLETRLQVGLLPFAGCERNS